MTPAELPQLLLLLQLGATLYMVGLVWFVQRVHYPLLARVGAGQFRAYEAAHLARTGPVVGPAMLLELGAVIGGVVWRPSGIPEAAPWLGVGLLGAIWLSTFLLQAPRHRQLAAGFDAASHRRLVAGNWIRTAAWSLRGLLVLWMTLRLVAPA